MKFDIYLLKLDSMHARGDGIKQTYFKIPFSGIIMLLFIFHMVMDIIEKVIKIFG